MEAHRDALGHFQLKLGMLNPDMPIEEQLRSLSKYHDIPDIESIKNGETQLKDGYINDFFLSQVKDFFNRYPKAYDMLGQQSDNILADYAALGIKYHLLSSGEKDKSFREKSIRAYYEYLPKYNRKNEMSIFQKRNEQIFSFFASFFLLLFRPLKHQLKADFKPLKQA